MDASLSDAKPESEIIRLQLSNVSIGTVCRIKAAPLLLLNKQQMSHIWPDLLAIITRKKTS